MASNSLGECLDDFSSSINQESTIDVCEGEGFSVGLLANIQTPVCPKMKNSGRKKTNPAWEFFQDMRNTLPGVQCLYCGFYNEDRSPTAMKYHIKRFHDTGTGGPWDTLRRRFDTVGHHKYVSKKGVKSNIVNTYKEENANNNGAGFDAKTNIEFPKCDDRIAGRSGCFALDAKNNYLDCALQAEKNNIKASANTVVTDHNHGGDANVLLVQSLSNEALQSSNSRLESLVAGFATPIKNEIRIVLPAKIVVENIDFGQSLATNSTNAAICNEGVADVSLVTNSHMDQPKVYAEEKQNCKRKFDLTSPKKQPTCSNFEMNSGSFKQIAQNVLEGRQQEGQASLEEQQRLAEQLRQLCAGFDGSFSVDTAEMARLCGKFLAESDGAVCQKKPKIIIQKKATKKQQQNNDSGNSSVVCSNRNGESDKDTIVGHHKGSIIGKDNKKHEGNESHQLKKRRGRPRKNSVVAPFSLCDVSRIVELTEIASELELELKLTPPASGTIIEYTFCARSLLANTQEDGTNEVKNQRRISISEDLAQVCQPNQIILVRDYVGGGDSDPVAEEAWPKSTWSLFQWAIRGKCGQFLVTGAGGRDGKSKP